MITDTERLDWLAQEGYIDVRPVRQIYREAGYPDDAEYQAGIRVNLFTVSSQFVKGRHLREAIDLAMTKSKAKQMGSWKENL